MPELYDSFTYETLMAGIVIRFERQPLMSLAEEISIQGPGIYSLFYNGAHEAYKSISQTSRPIYAGKAIPPGSRRGDEGDVRARVLQRRIREHQVSIREAENLEVEDFAFRSLAVVPAWINLSERAVIQHYRPVWNACLDGFGDHNPGSGRLSGERSWWDTLHPGRTWADSLQDNKTADEARDRVSEFLSVQAPGDG